MWRRPSRAASRFCPGANTPGRSAICTSLEAASLLRNSTPCSVALRVPLSANCETEGARDSVWMPTRACCPEDLLTRRIIPTTQLLPPSGWIATSAPTRSQSPFPWGTSAPNPPALTFSMTQVSAENPGAAPRVLITPCRPLATVSRELTRWRWCLRSGACGDQ
jgi:hypothetical protein